MMRKECVKCRYFVKRFKNSVYHCSAGYCKKKKR